jgi:hypothetical protein
MKKIACVILLMLAGTANAALITGVTATTDMGSGFDTNIANTVNGAGLSSLDLTATHAGSSPSNSWVSSQVTTGSIIFDFGQSFLVDSFSFWNQNGEGPGSLGSTGINSLNILYSADGISFASLFGNLSTFALVPDNLNLSPEIFSFSAVDARYFRFDVLSNYGDTGQTGFAEIAFNGTTTVPVPAAVWLFGSGLLGLIGIARRKKM